MKENGNLREIGLKKMTALLIGAVAAAVATILLIAVFAFIMLKAELSASAENIGIICISVISCFAGGFFCGRRNEKRGFLWGLAVGCLYFLFLLLLRAGSGQQIVAQMFSLFTTFLYCAGSGMLGGMFS